MKRHMIGMLVEDKPGVLVKIAGLFSRRGFNLETITVSKTTNPGISRMVFTIQGDDRILEQVNKQVNKLIDVIKVAELNPEESVANELCFVKINIPNKKAKNEIMNYANIYTDVKAVDITPKSIIYRVVGSTGKIDSFIDVVKHFGIKEISRTGITAMMRGQDILKNNKIESKEG
jgi:acetolactate synthase-1/3 small subunit